MTISYTPLALFLLRAFIGLLMAGHGVQKLFGWFDGAGLDGFSARLAKLGMRPARLWAWVSALIESFGGLCLALGILTPVAAALLITNLAMAILKVHLPNGFWNTRRGFEFPLTLAVGAAAIGLAGPGAYALGPQALLGLGSLELFLLALAAGMLGLLLAQAVSQTERSQNPAG